MRHPSTTIALAALAVVCGVVSPAGAHTRSVSYSRWALAPGGARVELRVPSIELTRFAPAAPVPAYFAGRLTLRAGGEPCAAGVVERDLHAEGWTVFRWSVQCAPGGERSVESRLFAGMGTAHVHFARVSTAAGELRERFLTEQEPVWLLERARVPAVRAAGATIARYVGLGVEHIASGWDHLAFVFALLLLAFGPTPARASPIAEVATLVSAFTLAHSVTLALAVLGIVHPRPGAVETVIGFSIALVAAENAWLLAARDRAVPRAAVALVVLAAVAATVRASSLPAIAWFGLAVFSFCHFGLLDVAANPARMRAAMAFAFGLVHGLGFAGVLMEMDLSAGELVPALFGFNTGVEVGQLAVVALAWPLLALVAARSGRWHRMVVEAGSMAILTLGVFWMVARGWT